MRIKRELTEEERLEKKRKRSEYQKEWREGLSPERRGELLKAKGRWYQEHKEECLIKNKEWTKNHPEARKKALERYNKSVRDIVEHRRLKNTYGITPEQLAEMETRQSGRCAICRYVICKRPPNGEKRLHIDHCHETGEVRGLLCWSCNSSLGSLGDSTERILSAIKYLESDCFIPFCYDSPVEEGVNHKVDIRLRRLFGISWKSLCEEKAKREDRCDICKRKMDKGNGPVSCCVDHCHKTGKVRGLICRACNTGIGKFKDSPALLRRAISYLKGELLFS